MSLFQHSVLKKYLQELDKQQVETAYNKFISNFGNIDKQNNIRQSKEEQYQEGFLNDLFVNVLGYTKNPEPKFNITTEYKNEKDAKKADGAILKDDKPIAIIELKGTDTIELDKVEQQAFNYKNNQSNCKYIITSNFEKLRFYIENAIDYEEFNLFNLSKDGFSLLYLCLSKDNILNDLPLKIKQASLTQEENITKKLYSDYSTFKRLIFQSIVEINPQFDKLLLYKKTQKLLDRFLFIFFAEDRLLIPPNSIREIILQWEKLKDLDNYVPLYDRFKKYFGYLNTGHKGKEHEIFAYNGGLFEPDEVLDNIKIDDNLLHDNTFKLSDYDYETDVDVNILGHIFEHSLNEIEEVEAELLATENTLKNNESQLIENSKKTSKRKKDGVFYTPKYITKYIVDNTLGTLCNEKKIELGINEDEFGYEKRKNKRKELIEKLNTYRNWLLKLTICDPACGSGAFLNQALNYLIDEHKIVDELQSKVLGEKLLLSDIENSILENNLYGVDLNDESIEIAKLSLWLRTAQKGRKLTSLNKNIKCGNSLIDDPAIAGEKAFNWQNQFPEIFKEKEKKMWHITCATHNSRYSQRMFDNHVKLGEPVWLSPKEEEIVSETISEIVKSDNLNILAYNICGDHMHILLVCEEEEVPKIIQKTKSMSARACNIAMGRTIPMPRTTSEHTRLSRDIRPSVDATIYTESLSQTREHAPLSIDTPLFGEAPLSIDTPLSIEAPSSSDTTLSTEHAPLYTPISTPSPIEKENSRRETQAHLWTQKYGCKEIISDEQLNNTISYIQNNRNKHQLPQNKTLQAFTKDICCTLQHAFRKEYNGGFDVVIGNPPYVDMRNMLFEEIKYYKKKFITASDRLNLFGLFVEQSFNKMNKESKYGMIIHRNLIRSNEYEKCRELILNNTELNSILSFKNGVFDGVTGEMTVLTFSKNSNINLENEVNIFNYETKIENSIYESKINQDIFNKCLGKRFNVYLTKEKSFILDKLLFNHILLGKISYTLQGIIAGDEKKFISNTKLSEEYKPIIRGRNIKRYLAENTYEYIYFVEGTKVLVRSRKKENFECSEKILTQHVSGGINAYLDENKLYYMQTINGTIISDENYKSKYILALLNSKVISFYYDNIFNIGAEFTTAVAIENLDLIPIKKTSLSAQQPFIEKADTMLSKNKELQEIKTKFIKLLSSKYNELKITNKLEDWYNLNFNEFSKELEKQKIKLSLSQQAEWLDYFENEKAKAQEIKTIINKTDKEIDAMVYQLYQLTEDEIKIVEG